LTSKKTGLFKGWAHSILSASPRSPRRSDAASPNICIMNPLYRLSCLPVLCRVSPNINISKADKTTEVILCYLYRGSSPPYGLPLEGCSVPKPVFYDVIRLSRSPSLLLFAVLFKSFFFQIYLIYGGISPLTAHFPLAVRQFDGMKADNPWSWTYAIYDGPHTHRITARFELRLERVYKQPAQNPDRDRQQQSHLVGAAAGRSWPRVRSCGQSTNSD